ncbi:hypothetical protein BV20DRAFT_508318 [Pilatotrama ljubarskyi]|nr:hypothetical protein BV20DRAFT_508318 [Pilatotrama ljubarskyi]
MTTSCAVFCSPMASLVCSLLRTSVVRGSPSSFQYPLGPGRLPVRYNSRPAKSHSRVSTNSHSPQRGALVTERSRRWGIRAQRPPFQRPDPPICQQEQHRSYVDNVVRRRPTVPNHPRRHRCS